MRKIEEAMCDAIASGRDWSSSNTSVFTWGRFPGARVFLHGNHIATVTDERVEIHDGGWQTVTTKSRLNAILDTFTGAGVFQRIGSGSFVISRMGTCSRSSMGFQYVGSRRFSRDRTLD